MALYTCYASIEGIGVEQVGPPAELNMTVRYEICDTLANVLQVCASSADYVGQIAAVAALPATQLQIRTAAGLAVQAAETGYPLLVFVWIDQP